MRLFRRAWMRSFRATQAPHYSTSGNERLSKDAARIFSRREEQGRHRMAPSRPVRQTVFLCLFDRRVAKTHGAALEVRAAPADRAGTRTGAPRDEAVPP